MRARYVRALLREYALRKDYLAGEPVRTVYLGGGTPSVLTPELLTLLLSGILKENKDTEETTMECNPDDVSAELAECMSRLGVDRVSMGVQTFSNVRLRFIRRRHTAEDVYSAVKTLRAAGITNISIDLIFGFPGQTTKEWLADIDEALRLDVSHISAYCLTCEPGTPLYAMLFRGEIREADEETAREMYYSLIDRLTSAGYEHYEISNFCRPGMQSKHNSNYWRAVPYLGLGAAAHSYDRRSRGWNIDNLARYMEGIERGGPCFEREELDADARYNDMITTALRTREGIDISVPFENKDYLLAAAEPLLRRRLLVIDRSHLRLTRDALFISDSVLTDLIKP